MTSASNDDPPVSGTTRATLQKIWMGLATTTLLLAYLAFSRVQGEAIEFGASAPVKVSFKAGMPDAVVAMWAILLVGLFYGMSAGVMREHAARGGANWLERYPFRLLDAAPSIGVGRNAQYVAFLFATVAPAYAILHFWRVFLLEGRLCRSESGKPLAPLGTKNDETVGDGLARFFQWPDGASWRDVFFDGYRLAGEEVGDKICSGATTFWPLVTPLLMATLTVAVFAVAARALFVVFRAPSRTPAEAPCARSDETG